MSTTEARPDVAVEQEPSRTGRLLLAALIGMIIGAVVSLGLGPRTPTLGESRAGDVKLAEDVRSSLVSDRGLQTLSVARVRDGQVSYAGLGDEDGAVPSPQTPFELGSITKTLTGLLLADGVQRGELALGDRLAAHLPELRGTAAGEVTLEHLATHTSGLPGLPPAVVAGSLIKITGNQNPYAFSVETVIEASRTTELKRPGHYAYSNLGMSLLGHAEARAAGAPDWATLATERILRPLGMTATTIAMTAAEVPAGATPIHKENGWRAPYWYGSGFAPSGTSTYTTAADLARYAQAVLAGTAPGMAALDPRADSDNGRIGLAWQTSEIEGRVITWHNGGTGGTRTMLALDRDRGQAVVIMGNTARWVNRVGLTLAAAESEVRAVDRPDWPGIPSVAGTVAGLLFLLTLVIAAVRAGDKLAVVNGLLSGAAGLLILLAHGPWSLVPGWVWGAVAGLAVVCGVAAVRRARTLPAGPARKKVSAWLSVAVTCAMLACAIWVL